jgi:c(7)-type cytochrome triheme protein
VLLSFILAAVAVEQARSQTKSRDSIPCDPIFVSGITGECAGTGDPTGFAGEAERAGMSDHPLALELSNLPKDRYGLIDWADAIKNGTVKPRHSFNPQDPDQPQIDMDVVIFTKSSFMSDVIFPHKVHELWLTCTNCHPGIFPMNAKEANKMMTMPKISAGEFCGRCHNRVAFPLTDCLRCHIKPREVPPIDPEADRWGIKPLVFSDPAAAAVSGAAGKVELSPKAYSLNPCETRQYSATVSDANGGTVSDAKLTYQSSDPNVASIDATGTAKGLNPGYTFITATHGKIKSGPVSLFIRDKNTPRNC